VSRANVALSDQAGELRRIVEQHKRKGKNTGNLKTFTVLSGKGGVGKSNFSVSLACAMADQGRKIVLLDADLGLANLDMLWGVTAKYKLSHLINGSKGLNEVLLPLEDNVWMLPGGTGLRELADMEEGRLVELIDNLGVLEDRADVLIVDTGAGIHKNVLTFAAAADTVILMTTPEPTAIRDAYGVLKALKNLSGNSQEISEESNYKNSAESGLKSCEFKSIEKRDIVCVVNMANSEREGLEVANRIKMAASQFLGITVNYIGCVLKDPFVEQAVRIRKPFCRLFPDSPAAACVKLMAETLLPGDLPGKIADIKQPKGLKAFFYRLARGYFSGR